MSLIILHNYLYNENINTSLQLLVWAAGDIYPLICQPAELTAKIVACKGAAINKKIY